MRAGELGGSGAGGPGRWVVALWILVLAGCSWDGLRRGIYEGAVANEQNNRSLQGRPPADPPPTFDQYERHRTTPDR